MRIYQISRELRKVDSRPQGRQLKFRSKSACLCPNSTVEHEITPISDIRPLKCSTVELGHK